MMSGSARTVVGVVAAVLAVAGGAAHAATSCATELDSVGGAIVAATFFGKNAATNETNLLAKLEAARAKLGLGKPGDAVDKLQDISDTATALADATKPKLDDASVINAAVATAIVCIGTP